MKYYDKWEGCSCLQVITKEAEIITRWLQSLICPLWKESDCADAQLQLWLILKIPPPFKSLHLLVSTIPGKEDAKIAQRRQITKQIASVWNKYLQETYDYLKETWNKYFQQIYDFLEETFYNLMYKETM